MKQDYSRRKVFDVVTDPKKLEIDFQNTAIDTVSLVVLPSGAIPIIVEVSIDGEDGNWREIDSFTALVAGTFKIYEDNTHRFFRATSTNITQTATFEIAGM